MHPASSGALLVLTAAAHVLIAEDRIMLLQGACCPPSSMAALTHRLSRVAVLLHSTAIATGASAMAAALETICLLP